MTEETFYEEQTTQSRIKSEIVSKYFKTWAKVILGAMRKGRSGERRIAYVDLFAGKGAYDNGAISTPLQVLRFAIEDPEIRRYLVTIFNDKNPSYTEELRSYVYSLPGIETLAYKPQFFSTEVGEDVAEAFSKVKLVPTLSFVDPWGYKGLSVHLVTSLIKDWGSDCVFFLNFTRFNAAVSNHRLSELMSAFFTPQEAVQLSIEVQGLKPLDREFAVLERLTSTLIEFGGKYVLPFTFKTQGGKKTSHHLVFVSKHPKGYEIMKNVMAKYSTDADQGVPSFAYNPATERWPFLFEFTRPLEQLREMLQSEFAGKRLAMHDIYLQHSVGRPYVEANYKEVLRQLEAEGLVKCTPTAEKRRMRSGKRTFGDNVMVEFPRKRE